MLSDDLNACGDLLRRGDPDRFLAAMAAPVAARRVLFPLYAFNLEVARAPWVTQEPVIAEMRLQWWRDALEEIREGGAVRRNELVTPLAEVLDATGAARLEALIEARRWDIYREPFADQAAFERYIDDTSGTLLGVTARALGPADEGVSRDAGYALGLANWFRAIPALEAAGRIPLVDGRPEALRALASEGLARLGRARAARRKVSRAAGPAFFPLWQAGPILARVRRVPGAVAEGALDIAPVRSRLTLMLRASTGYW
ncbi:squalene/phytoene synthase family protein [Roseovarius sp.]|uniref:squalene/phytoene synthase family protein n=1 Tax=Roseovarius sp. TaxID=1486281 RepID=UPI002631EA14|nr:squalene/phytoene synthase family protein [Roseovarius sp.]